ncbi:MAG: GSCFA domain-containing protein [Acidobacteriia bacterium]|nr:GSCFA domain-containing protein [Terriglobia bacterium]
MKQSNASRGAGAHPYADLPHYAFWNRAVAGVPPFAVDPVVDVPFRISPSDAVATAGSCFAQHIARGLQQKRFHYLVAEPAPAHLTPAAAAAANYGVFSARYGNIYTTRQLLQLFERAYGAFVPSLSSWRTKGGGHADPFRPRIEPGGFASETELLEDRTRHLACVRRLFEELDIFVFTLGLTESWEHQASHAALPLAPGVAGGEWDPGQYEFRNYSAAEVERDLTEFVDRLRSVNPSSRMVLTVSPVPLAATGAGRHVLTSTCLSKAALRVAAEACASKCPGVCYFPSYEIITGPHSGSRYFEDDLRTVTRAGVGHVMRVFFSHFADGSAAHPDKEAETLSYVEAELAALGDIVCDEEALSG